MDELLGEDSKLSALSPSPTGLVPSDPLQCNLVINCLPLCLSVSKSIYVPSICSNYKLVGLSLGECD